MRVPVGLLPKLVTSLRVDRGTTSAPRAKLKRAATQKLMMDDSFIVTTDNKGKNDVPRKVLGTGART